MLDDPIDRAFDGRGAAKRERTVGAGTGEAHLLDLNELGTVYYRIDHLFRVERIAAAVARGRRFASARAACVGMCVGTFGRGVLQACMRTRASEYARSSAMLGAGVASTAHTERTDIHVHLPVPLRAQERARSYLIHRLGLGRCRGGRSGALFRHAVGAVGGICPARAQWRRRRALGQPQRRANGSGVSSKFAKSRRK